jgi:transmembrane sensor
VSKDRTNNIEEAASQWLVRRDSGQWTQADQTQFESWLDASTLNRVAFLRLELAWEESARLKALGAGVAGDMPPPPGRWNINSLFFHQHASEPAASRRKLPRLRGRRIAAAASVLFAVAAFGAYQFGTDNSEHFATQIGGLEKVPMLDGSRITLNTNSELSVALTDDERRIDLERGEAFFEVAHDADRPFIVDVGGKRVIAVGTKFSVRRNGQSIEVVVTEGKVRMEPRGAGETVFLVAGEVALSNDAGLLVQRGTVEDAETRLSWRDGVLSFRDMPLAEAVAEFNRYNVRKITIAEPAVAAMKVEGNFRPTNVQAFVRLLESGFPIRASVSDESIVLGSR